MRSYPLFWLAWLLSCAPVVLAQTTPDSLRNFEEADLRILRLPPSAFPDLPHHLRRDLERRGCSVPQLWVVKKPHNVIKGRFFRAGQVDWAVLCSVDRVSVILVYRNGSTLNPSAIAREPDMSRLQEVGNNEIGYSRGIGLATRAYILSHDRAQTAPKIDHDGINDAFAEKGSVVMYFHNGKWIELEGAD